MSRKKVRAKQQQKHQQSQGTRSPQKPSNQSKSLLSKTFSLAWKVFAGFAVLLGVAVALYPKPSVTPSTYLDPSNPLKTLFNVSNDGFIPLHDVQVSCAINQVVLINGAKMIGGTNYSTRLFNPIHYSQKITSGETDTVFCPLGALKIPLPVKSADIAIVVSFSTFGIHWPNRVFPFTTQNDINGQLHWIKHPLKK